MVDTDYATDTEVTMAGAAKGGLLMLNPLLLLSLLLLLIPGIHTVLDTDTMADMVDTAMDMDMLVTWEATMAGAARRGLLMLSQLLLLIPGMCMVLDTEDIMADTAMVDTSAMVDMEAICGAVRGGLLMLSPLLMLIPGIHMVDTAIMVDTDMVDMAMAMAMDTDWAMGMVDTMAGGSKLDSATHLITTCRTLSV